MKYQGQRDIDSLAAFVTQHTMISPPTTEGEGEEEVEEVEEGGRAEEVKVDESGLVHLTDSNFQSFISGKSGLHFVKFYAPWSVLQASIGGSYLHPFLSCSSGVATASVLPQPGTIWHLLLRRIAQYTLSK